MHPFMKLSEPDVTPTPESGDPITEHCTIPIYLKQPEKSSGNWWLQWQRGRVRYGIAVAAVDKNLEECVAKAQQMIDVMLALESSGGASH